MPLVFETQPRGRIARWLDQWGERLIPADPDLRDGLRVLVFRIIALTSVALGLNYLYYRYTRSLNVNALWFAIPLLLAETYSFIDTLLFMFMMWRPALRSAPPTTPDHTVDVFITSYSEPVALVRQTAEAALRIRYPHNTYVLDDGNRPEMRTVCEEIGCGYITRGPEWQNRPRHAKAGNVNNALLQTTGEFVLILDADQIPEPEILDHTLGYFTDPKVAFVQTPQYFYNVPLGDPFGSQAPLFYGPIQRGKDGWNAAFFCGSNAVLRREALLQLGLVTYVQETQERLIQGLSRLPVEARGTRVRHSYRQAALQITRAAEDAVVDLREGRAIGDVLDGFHQALRNAQRKAVAGDLQNIMRDLAGIEAQDARSGENRVSGASEARAAIEHGLLALADELAAVAAPPPEALGLDPRLVQMLQMDSGEALDVQPLATFSITEDMATAMRLHSIGWQSVFHSEILAQGLAPEDLASALGQRLRWGAGTIQVMLHDNPLTKPGLSWPQRLQYFTTMYSYFSGFASLIYLVAPIIYLLTGISPVVSYASEFLWRIVPYLLVNKLMFAFVAWGIDVFRGEQYSLALFPLWIRAVVTVFGGGKLTFTVTPKTRQSGVFLNLVIPQLAIVVLLVMGVFYALFGLLVGWRNDMTGVIVNIFWAGYDIVMLSVILRAAVYRPPSGE